MPVIDGGTGIWSFAEMIVEWMTQGRGASNEKARRELGWTPKYPSWRDGFPVWVEEFESGKAA